MRSSSGKAIFLYDELIKKWPSHSRRIDFIKEYKHSPEAEFMDEVAHLITEILGSDGLDQGLSDYIWLCNEIVKEELHFRRTQKYRNSNFIEVERTVYSSPDFMSQYMSGLLLSQLFWHNHLQILEYYSSHFLKNNSPHFRHLEIGPGHGLFLYYAAIDSRCFSAEGWDISKTSIEHTRKALNSLGLKKKVDLVLCDATDPKWILGKKFESIVLSEILEHLENPEGFLSSLLALTDKNSRLFVNVPVNSPAPDHIYLWKSPEEVRLTIEKSGYTIVDQRFFPATGLSEEQARKKKAAISCGFTIMPK